MQMKLLFVCDLKLIIITLIFLKFAFLPHISPLVGIIGILFIVKDSSDYYFISF